MKKIILSAAVAAMAFSGSAMAADKGIDINVGGQAAVYYQTNSTEGGLFDEDRSIANVGLQLNLGADLGNNFTFGSQVSYLGTAGLEKNLVRGVSQVADDTVTQGGDTNNELALTKIFIAKQIANTTLKIGRQELPKSLSPLAFTEGWNVFKNTFDAIVAINTDIPKTTLVGAYVAGGTGMDLGSAGNLGAELSAGAFGGASTDVDGTAYMITAATTAIPMTAVTASYYHLSRVANNVAIGGLDNFFGPNTSVAATTHGIDADAFWLDISLSDKELPMGLTAGVQLGMIQPDATAKTVAVALTGVATQNLATLATAAAITELELEDTKVYGAKIGLKPVDALSLGLAYTAVSGDDEKITVAVKNTGTGVKTPLYTQMIANQDMISQGAKTIVVKAGYSLGDMGSLGVAYGMTDAKDGNLRGEGNDYKELDVTYKIKAAGVQYFAGYVHGDFKAADSDFNLVRIWARYNF